MSDTSQLAPSVVEIQGVVQKYAWGKKGNGSRVGMLSGEGAHLPEIPFAEMWFGAHPSFPSPIISRNLASPKETTKDLLQFISSSQNVTNPPLPFLMKILSVGAPLSIQLHPNKSDAERLHVEQPSHYPDTNHKPELAVALTDVELVCGIRPISEIEEIIEIIPTLKSILPNNSCNQKTSADAIEILRSLFNLPESDRKNIAENILTTESTAPLLFHHLRWIRAAAKKNSMSDPGLIGILLMNHITLSPGECVFIAPGIPHAYMTGDLVECMASSDNVVRAGLTEKFIDTKTFIQLVRYDPLMNPRLQEQRGREKSITFFTPPVPDFKLTRIKDGTVDLANEVKAPAIIMCQLGEATVTQEKENLVWPLQAGRALFVSRFDGPLLLSGTNLDVFIASANDTYSE